MAMEPLATIELSSGLKITIYSDGELNFDRGEIEKAFHASFLVLDQLPQSPYKYRLKEVKKKAEEGQFQRVEVLLAISLQNKTLA